MKKLLLFTLALVGASIANAATITVGTSGANYASLSDAITAASSGDVVQLITDITITSAVSITKGQGNSLTIDLAGHNISSTNSLGSSLFTVKSGNITFTNSLYQTKTSKITSNHTSGYIIDSQDRLTPTSMEISAIHTLTVEHITFAQKRAEAAVYFGWRFAGSATDCTFNQNGQSDWLGGGIGVYRTDATIQVNDCHMNLPNGTTSAIATMRNSSITVTGGEYISNGSCLNIYTSGGTITVNGGYYKSNGYVINNDGDDYNPTYKDYKKGIVNINDGIFNGKLYSRNNGNSGGQQNVFSISKGVFSSTTVYKQSNQTWDNSKFSTFVQSGKTSYTADGMTFVDYKAYTGSSISNVKPYADYAAAVAASETSINILEGLTFNESTTIANRTITAKGSFDALTVTGGTLTLDGATINAASGQNGIYVNGGNLIAQSSAVLNGGTNAVYVKSGDCTIQGSATANAGIYVDGGNLIAQGSAVLNTVDVNAGSFTVPESTTVTAGTLTKTAGEGATISLKSGTYSQDVKELGYVPEGYKTTDLGNNKWKVEDDKPYTRDVTIGAIGTICLNKDVKAGDFTGAIFYKTAYRISDTRIYFDEVDALEAGKAYIFEATATKISCKLSGTTADDPIAENGLYGTFDGINYSADPAGQASTSDETLKDMYLVNNDIIRLCGKGCWLAPNRAYINLSEVTDKATPAPGRRISLVNNDANTATFVEEVGAAAQGVKKAMINGQLIIMKDGKMFNAQGAEL